MLTITRNKVLRTIGELTGTYDRESIQDAVEMLRELSYRLPPSDNCDAKPTCPDQPHPVSECAQPWNFPKLYDNVPRTPDKPMTRDELRKLYPMLRIPSIAEDIEREQLINEFEAIMRKALDEIRRESCKPRPTRENTERIGDALFAANPLINEVMEAVSDREIIEMRELCQTHAPIDRACLRRICNELLRYRQNERAAKDATVRR